MEIRYDMKKMLKSNKLDKIFMYVVCDIETSDLDNVKYNPVCVCFMVK